MYIFNMYIHIYKHKHSKMDIGFDIGIVFWALFKSSASKHFLSWTGIRTQAQRDVRPRHIGRSFRSEATSSCTSRLLHGSRRSFPELQPHLQRSPAFCNSIQECWLQCGCCFYDALLPPCSTGMRAFQRTRELLPATQLAVLQRLEAAKGRTTS